MTSRKILLLSSLLAASMAALAGNWNAVCDAQHGDTKGWVGPSRATLEEAEQDAKAHEEEFGHEAKVTEIGEH